MGRGAGRAARRSSQLQADAVRRRSLEEVAADIPAAASQRERLHALGKCAPQGLALRVPILRSEKVVDTTEVSAIPVSATCSDELTKSGSLSSQDVGSKDGVLVSPTPRFAELAQKMSVQRENSAMDFLRPQARPEIYRQNSTTGAGHELAACLERRLSKEDSDKSGLEGLPLWSPRVESARRFTRRSTADSELAAKLQRQQERLSAVVA